MKQLIFCMALVFGMAMCAGAQDTQQTPAQPAPASTQSTQAQQTTTPHKGRAAGLEGPQTSPGAEVGDQPTYQVAGCISQDGNGNYVLTNKHYKNGVAVHGQAALAGEVGHMVLLSGDWVTQGKDFNATKVKTLSDTCQ